MKKFIMSEKEQEHLNEEHAKYLVKVYGWWQLATGAAFRPLDEGTLANFLEDLRTNVSFQNKITRVLDENRTLESALQSEFSPLQFCVATQWMREHPIMVYHHALKQLHPDK